MQAPRGTRDWYPEDLLQRRYVEKLWRDVATRFGFDEVDGPTFEHLSLYTIKSGDEIISQLFSFQRDGGETAFALRPEFTPTLARLYAAKAGGLAKPTKWWMSGPFFRAERPQRGRLREFLQWNVDFIGGEDTPEARAQADAEVISTCVAMLRHAGFRPGDVKIHVGDRGIWTTGLSAVGVPEEEHVKVLQLVDAREKMNESQLNEAATRLGLSDRTRDLLTAQKFDLKWTGSGIVAVVGDKQMPVDVAAIRNLGPYLHAYGIREWCTIDPQVVRGLAYYTGLVFEARATGERAVAGGGRYDRLIELMGGPPTPAVGFAMGDVVLSILMQEKGLMPQGPKLADAITQLPASVRPEVFVVSSGNEGCDAELPRLVTILRASLLHVRHTYKATKNLGKLLKDASGQGAKLAVIIESPRTASVKNLDTGEQFNEMIELAALPGRLRQMLGYAALA